MIKFIRNLFSPLNKESNKGKCTHCRFYKDLFCDVGSYYAEKGIKNQCWEGELWKPIKSK